jgi:hypothetical protein
MLNQEDELNNQFVKQFTRTRYKVGTEIRRKNGSVIRIVDVHPRGTISRSACKSLLSQRMLPPVVCDQDLYLYKGVSPGAPASGQTAEAGLLG